jgi:ABC-type multidrug transport system fused ATPase/permease subunit
MLFYCLPLSPSSGEAQMNAVERIKYYIDNIEQEDKATLPTDVKLPEDWPREGKVEGRNLQMRYRDGPLVLQGLDFIIDGKEKIGIAGRTGYVE